MTKRLLAIDIPYGRSSMPLTIESGLLAGVLRPAAAPQRVGSEADTVRRALANPIASPALASLGAAARSAVIITSDHTRPMPSRLTMPLLLAGLRQANPGLPVTILVATGCHRPTTRNELESRFGETICRTEEIVVHDCDVDGVDLGTLPSGGRLLVNRRAVETDLLIAEGFIEPHFFAGFSGGPKAVLPGIALRRTVLANHCSRFIAHPSCRSGSIDDNPIRADMVWAARRVGLVFALNVVLDENKKIIAAVAGDPIDAHGAGCGIVGGRARVAAVAAKVCITSNGGYPLDQNLYQCVKGLTAAEATLEHGGVIIMVAACEDGDGGGGFRSFFDGTRSPRAVLDRIMATPQSQTEPDQWQAQILARVLDKCRVIMVSEPGNRAVIESMFMHYAANLNQALAMTGEMLGERKPIAVIPDGVGVIVA